MNLLLCTSLCRAPKGGVQCKKQLYLDVFNGAEKVGNISNYFISGNILVCHFDQLLSKKEENFHNREI